MGLIYVNPEGPEGKPDPLAAANDIRETFGRMAMNDEETAALIVGGHTFGKTHGAGDGDLVGPEPEAAPLEQQGLGWKCAFATGKAGDTITSGLEVVWTTHADQVGQRLPGNPLRQRVGADQEPRRRLAVRGQGRRSDHPGSVRRHRSASPTMLVTDISMRVDPDLRADHPPLAGSSRGDDRGVRQGLVQAAAPRHGPGLPLPGPVDSRAAAVAGPGARPVDHELIDEQDIAALKGKVLNSGLSAPQLIKTAWSAASSFRGTDKRGGANGARLRLEPQQSWEVNEPAELAKVLPVLEQIQQDFNGSAGGGKKVSLADLIVLAGSAAVEKAAKDAGYDDRRCTSRPGAPTPPRRAPTSSRSRCSSRGPTVSATMCGPARRPRWSSCWWNGPTCWT